MTKDEETKRQNEKIEFLARTNMLYSDWEHRNNQVTSDLVHKGIEEAKINAELRAEIERLKAQLAQPEQEPTDTLLNALDYAIVHGWPAESLMRLTAIRGADKLRHSQSLAQPEQSAEPVELLKKADVFAMAVTHGIDANTKGLYGFYIDCMSTTPPKREWVGLTDEDIGKWIEEEHDVIRWAESKLKENNS